MIIVWTNRALIITPADANTDSNGLLVPRLCLGTHRIGGSASKSRRSLRRGIDIADQRARQVQAEDFDRFDLVLAMDEGHYQQLQRLCPDHQRHRLRLFLEFAPALGVRDVPDPYYGGPDGFETVLDMIEAASAGLLAEIRADNP